MKKHLLLYLLLLVGLTQACSDDDSFTTSRSAMLTFSVDTLKLDTVFSTVGSSTYTFWVFNHASDGLRLSSVRLQQGNQTGFRVNVDGTYLDNSLGSVVTDLEIRKGDSIRVFVELTAAENGQLTPQKISDDLVFQLESGVIQRVNLCGYTWDALPLRQLKVRRDTMIASDKPIVVYGGIRVDSAATLTLQNSSLFFHADAGIDVYGKLLTNHVVMRGDRLDYMFDYLPYDRISGQWKGIHFFSSSTGNVIFDTEIRNAMTGILCDSARFSKDEYRLYMEQCVVHNCKGAGIQAFQSTLGLLGCQITNTLDDCLAVYGGLAILESCTVAQFYPFSANCGVALRFGNHKDGKSYPLEGLVCKKSIVTGYDADVVMGEAVDTTAAFAYYFEKSLLRTPVVNDSILFKDVIWESPKDSIQGKQHFVLIDEKNYRYDFHLDSLSTAKGMGCY